MTGPLIGGLARHRIKFGTHPPIYPALGSQLTRAALPAVASQRFDIFNTLTGIGLGQAERTRWGGVVGVGLEYGFAPNWTAGIEYDYLFRESDSRTFLTPNLAIGPFTANTRSDVSMITGRISYKVGMFFE